MAVVLNVSIPPELAERFWDVVQIHNLGESGWLKAGIAPNVRNPIPRDPRSMLMKGAEKHATWLANRYIGKSKTSAWRDFRYLKRNEIMAGVFDPLYWKLIDPQTETVGVAVPSCTPYTGAVNPLFDDALRQPSFCRDYVISTQHPLDQSGVGMPKPMPGWGGAVVGGRFVDQYAAQLRLSYKVPVEDLVAEWRPMAIVADIVMNVEAEKEANVVWSAFDVSMKWRWPPNNYPLAGRKIVVHAKKRFRERVKPPPAVAPYLWQYARKLVVPAEWIARDINWVNSRHWDVYISSMPSLGVYYSLNANVSVSFSVSAKLCMARL